jgi:hypothetical protein
MVAVGDFNILLAALIRYDLGSPKDVRIGEVEFNSLLYAQFPTCLPRL